jgi:hypothetical protein
MTDSGDKRRVFFRRRDGQPQAEPPQESGNEIPRASKQEIRHLIEVEEATSTTKIADSLNEGRFPPATAEKWTAALVDSALRRQDMDGLREKMKENRGEPESAGVTALEVRQAAYDGAREALKDGTKVEIPEIPPAQIDVNVVRSAVADATQHVLKDFRKQIDVANDQVAGVITQRVRTTMQQLMNQGDISTIRRVTNKTGENVGRVLAKVDETCDELRGSVVGTLQEHSKAVTDACELMALQISEDLESRIDARFDVLEDKLIEKFTTGMNIDLDAVVARAVDDRLKAHMDEMANRLAVMVEKVRATMTGDKVRKVK